MCEGVALCEGSRKCCLAKDQCDCASIQYIWILCRSSQKLKTQSCLDKHGAVLPPKSSFIHTCPLDMSGLHLLVFMAHQCTLYIYIYTQTRIYIFITLSLCIYIYTYHKKRRTMLIYIIYNHRPAESISGRLPHTFSLLFLVLPKRS